MDELSKLAERVESGKGLDNALDVLVEVALFEPGESAVSARANAAGTKVIYTYADGTQQTFWADIAGVVGFLAGVDGEPEGGEENDCGESA